jgi:hypothetical protein
MRKGCRERGDEGSAENGRGESGIQEAEGDGGTGIWDNKTGNGIPAVHDEGIKASRGGMGFGKHDV